VDKAFESLPNPDIVTQQQYQNASNSINWTSYKNWGIISLCVVIGLMIISFVKQIFNMFLSMLR
jgi:hypothetical protein